MGIFERIEDGKLSAAKVTFGAEPKDCEVQEYIQKWYFSLKFSPVVETAVKDIKRNPKRMQREAKKQMLEIGIGTKSQQALKLQQEQNKQERKEKSRKRKEAEEQRMFELKQRKKLEENGEAVNLVPKEGQKAVLLDGGNQIITAPQQCLFLIIFHSVYSKPFSAHQRIASSRYASAR